MAVTGGHFEGELASGIVTVLFTDLVGSTTLLSRLGDDAYESLRRVHFEVLTEVVDGHGGLIVKNLGDGLMVVHDSAVGAVGCAVAMQQAVERHARRSGEPLAIRIGLDAGEATIEDGDYFGTPVVVAKRLCDAADGGQIWSSVLLRDLVGRRGAFEFGPVTTFELKGLPEPQSACELRWPRAGDEAGLPIALAMPPGSLFIGRATESDSLFDLWKGAAAGERQAVFVGGEPGVGKTRLASALAHRIAATGGEVLYGRCDEGLGVPYQPFVELLRGHVSTCTDRELEAQVGPGAAVLAPLLPEFERFADGSSVASLAEPEAARYRMFEAVTAVFERASTVVPLMLVLDDLHWATAPTILLLRHMLRSTRPMSALVVATYRPTDVDPNSGLSDLLADLRGEPDVRRLTLAGLDASGVHELVAAVAGHALDDRASDFADALHSQTRGNPFFVREVLSHLAETGVIYERDGRWTTDLAPTDTIGLPEGVREVVVRRLGRLSEGANKTLSVASVLGASFSWRELEAVASTDPDELLDHLDEAVAAGLLVEASDGYSFAHALVRNALYGGLSGARRARLHRSVAQALERLPDAARRTDALAYHYVHAAVGIDVTKAVEYSLAAATEAMHRLAYEEARRLLDRALDVVGPEGADAVARAEVLLALTDVQARMGEVTTARATAFAAADAARAAGSGEQLARAFIAFMREGIINAGIKVPGLAELGEEVLGFVDDKVQRATVMAALSFYLAGSPYQMEEAAHLADDALALARDCGSADALGEALLAQSRVLIGLPRLDQLFVTLDELLVLGQRTENLRCVEGALSGRTIAHLRSGDLSAVSASLADLDVFAEQRRDWVALAQALACRAGLALLAGAFSDAERLADEALAAARDDLDFVNVWGALRMQAAYERGEWTEMVPMLAAGIEEMPNIPAFRSLLALIDAQEGRSDAAAATLAAMREGLAAIPRNDNFTTCLATMAEGGAVLDEGPTFAAPILERLAPYAGSAIAVSGTGVSLGAVDRYLGILYTMVGRFDDAAASFEAAIALETKMASRPLLARTSYWYARSRLRAGDRERAGALLDDCRAHAADLGMAKVLEQAEALATTANVGDSAPR